MSFQKCHRNKFESLDSWAQHSSKALLSSFHLNGDTLKSYDHLIHMFHMFHIVLPVFIFCGHTVRLQPQEENTSGSEKIKSIYFRSHLNPRFTILL